MSMRASEGEASVPEVAEAEAPEAAEVPGLSLEAYLPDAEATGDENVAPRGWGAGLRTAQVARVSGRRAFVVPRGAREPVEASIAEEVDPEVIEDALESGNAVLVEPGEGEALFVVGALVTRKPQEIRLKAATVHIEGEREVLVRSGRGAIRIREDGDIEVLGSRISAASRGLFRIVGRMLRLN
jgi:hypothetical protein